MKNEKINSIRYIPILFLLVFISGCELEKFPYDSLSKDDFNTLTGVKLLSTGIYSELSSGIDEVYISFNNHSSDNFAKLTRNANEEPGSFTTNVIDLLANGNVSWGFWKNCYKNIRTCNNVISQNRFGTDASMNEAVAELYFLRAYNYHLLASMFCRPYTQKDISNLGLPLRLDPEDSSEAARSSLDELYSQIIKDLETALNYLNPVDDRSRASREAAQALLARTLNLMLDPEYPDPELAGKIIENAEAVLASSQVSMETNSASFFGSSTVQKNEWPSNTHHYYASAATSSETIWVLVRNSFTSLSDCLDADYNQSAQGFYLPVSNDYTDLLNQYPEDLRNNLIDKSYDTNGALKYADLTYKAKSTNCNKYSFQDGQKNLGSMIVLRATEMYFILAEVYAKQGDLEKVLEYINPIRKRAGIEEFTQNNWNANHYGITDLLDLVLNEKRLEMLGENQRRSDVYRNKKDILRSYSFDSDIYLERVEEGTISRWDSDEIIVPIPYGQILQAPNMEQNPY